MGTKAKKERLGYGNEAAPLVNKRVFIAGMMRSGTLWLSDVIAKNAYVPSHTKFVTHEESKEHARRLLHRWGKPGLHVEVGHTFALLPALMKQYPDTTLRFIIRDPLPQIESLCSWFDKDSDGEALTMANFNWSSLETGLRMLEEAGIETRAWHFSAYTTPDGVGALMDDLGIPRGKSIDVSAARLHDVPPHRRVIREEWGDEICEMLMDLWHSNKRVLKLYQEAHRPPKPEEVTT